MNTRPELHRTSSNPSVSAERTAGKSRNQKWNAFIQSLLDNLKHIQGNKEDFKLIEFSFLVRNDKKLSSKLLEASGKEKLLKASVKDKFVDRLIDVASQHKPEYTFNSDEIQAIQNTWGITNVPDLVQAFFDLSDLQQYLTYIQKNTKYQSWLHDRMKGKSDKKNIFPRIFMELCEKIKTEKSEDEQISFNEKDVNKIMEPIEEANFPDEEPDEADFPDEEPDERGDNYKIVGMIWS